MVFLNKLLCNLFLHTLPPQIQFNFLFKCASVFVTVYIKLFTHSFFVLIERKLFSKIIEF